MHVCYRSNLSSCLKIFNLVLILNLLCLLALEDKGLRINPLWVKLKLTWNQIWPFRCICVWLVVVIYINKQSFFLHLKGCCAIAFKSRKSLTYVHSFLCLFCVSFLILQKNWLVKGWKIRHLIQMNLKTKKNHKNKNVHENCN